MSHDETRGADRQNLEAGRVSRFLTADEKARELAFFAAQREDPGNWRRAHEGERAGLGDVGYIDHEVVPLCDLLNAIDGVCTLQSCCGHRYPSPSGDGDCVSGGLIRLRLDERMGRLLDERVGELLAEPVIRHVVKGYALTGGWERRSEPREPYEYIDLSFHGCEDGGMEEAERVIAGFFAALAASSSQDRDARALAEPDSPPARVSEELRERRAEEHRRLVAERQLAAARRGEPTSFTAEDVAVNLAEAMDEVRREPRTSLWRSFWDRLTEGGEAPAWPFEDEEPVHLVAAPSPTGDRERQIELIAAELRREPSRLNTIEERAEALLDALGAISSGDTAGEGRPPRDATDPLPQGRWLIDVCVECGGAVAVSDPPQRRQHQSGVCSGWGCGGLRTVEVMPVPGAREDER